MSGEKSIEQKLSSVADAALPLMTLIDDQDLDGAAVDVLHGIGSVLEAAEWAIACEAGRVLAGYERTRARDILVLDRLDPEDPAERFAYIDWLLAVDADLANNANEFERIGLDFLKELGGGPSARTPIEVRNVLVEVLSRLNAAANNPLLRVLINSLRALNWGQCQDLVKPSTEKPVRPPHRGAQALNMKRMVSLGGEILKSAGIVDSKQQLFRLLQEGQVVSVSAIEKWEGAVRRHFGDEKFNFEVEYTLNKLEDDRYRDAVLDMFAVDRLRCLIREFYSSR